MLVNKESVGFRLKGRFEGVILCSERCFFHGDAVVEAAVCVKEETIVCSSGSHVSSQYGAPNLDEICARHLEPEVGEVEKKKNAQSISRERLFIPFPSHTNQTENIIIILISSARSADLSCLFMLFFCFVSVCVCVCVCVSL